MFTIGDKVVHPVHGAGIIEKIETREIGGTLRDYFVLNIQSCNMRVMIPCANAEETGVRSIIPKAEYEKVLQVLSGKSEHEENFAVSKEKWNYRYRLLMDKIKSGDVYELAEIIRVLSLRNQQKPLSSGEKRLLDQARDILISELALVTEESMDEISSTVDDRLHLTAVGE